MYKRGENNTALLCMLCMLMPQILPLMILTSVHTWYEESTPRENYVLQIMNVMQHNNYMWSYKKTFWF